MAGDFTVECEPTALFQAWMEAAVKSEPNDPNAMVLASVDQSGLPDARMVLLKGADAQGFVFYTNLESAKGIELAGNPQAALLFHWKSLRRQIRLRGPVEPVTSEEADSYFATRPRDSRIGAWASHQSRPLASRAALEAAVADFTGRFAGAEVPRPPHWSGFRLRPIQMEFWRDRPFRLHDRVVFCRDAAAGLLADAAWRKERLYP